MKRFAVAVLAILIGCAAPPAARVRSQIGSVAVRIDLARALAHHPLTPVLTQYDADIATLQRAAETTAFKGLHGEIEAGSADIGRRLKAASARLRALRTQAIQLPQAAGTARRDFGGGIVTSFQQASRSRIERALDLRSSQLREHEATVAFDFERAHAGRRLVLGLKLRDLHLDAPSQRRYRGQLNALDRQETALVGAERRRDEAILSAYGADLRARALSDSASMASDLANHTRAMQRIPRPQMPAFPDSILHPDDARDATVAAFDVARSDLTSRFTDVQSIDDRAREDVRTEILDLVRERDTLRAQIVASIESRAQRIATARHLGRLYTIEAPRGARDITDEVLRSYWVSTGS